MFLTTTEKLNATPGDLDRYQDILEAELAFVKKLRKKLAPVIEVKLLRIAETSKVSSLLRLLQDTILDPETNNPPSRDLAVAAAVLQGVREGKQPVVTLQTPLNHYTIKQHPITKGFVIQVVTD